MTICDTFWLWCSSLSGHYICIVAVQHHHSSKFDLPNLSKLATVEESIFTSSHCTFAIQLLIPLYLLLQYTCVTKSKENLQALALNSRNSCTSWNKYYLAISQSQLLQYLTLIQTHQMFSLSRDIWAALTRPDIHWFTEHIIDLQPDFKEQKLFAHKTIEGTCHHCMMLPKYHYGLNFIEFF